MTPKLALFLRGYWTEREAHYRKLEKEFGSDTLVFTSTKFTEIDPGVLSHAFTRLAKRAGLSDVHFHTLRHSFASLMLSRGAKPKVISEALGHSSVAFTMDTYAHIISGMQEDAMLLLDEVLPVGVSRKNNVKLTATL